MIPRCCQADYCSLVHPYYVSWWGGGLTSCRDGKLANLTSLVQNRHSQQGPGLKSERRWMNGKKREENTTEDSSSTTLSNKKAFCLRLLEKSRDQRVTPQSICELNASLVVFGTTQVG